MDYNNLLFFRFLPIGQYDALNKKVHLTKLSILLNHICVAINFFCGLKTFFILILLDSKIFFYLIEIYIFESYIQKAFHLGIFFSHFLTGKFKRFET